MKAVIIDYGSGNLHSAAKAFERMGAETGHAVVVTSDPVELAGASHIVLPGVGAFGDCLAGLKALDGMWEALQAQVLEEKKPFLGICVGMQLLADTGYERGEHAGFGWIGGEVKAIALDDASLKIPHMGWNGLEISQPHPVFLGIKDGDHAYFVHSYQFSCGNSQNVVANVTYGGTITAAVAKDNMVGTQFHPEKSQQVGLALIKNFLEWDGQ